MVPLTGKTTFQYSFPSGKTVPVKVADDLLQRRKRTSAAHLVLNGLPPIYFTGPDITVGNTSAADVQFVGVSTFTTTIAHAEQDGVYQTTQRFLYGQGEGSEGLPQVTTHPTQTRMLTFPIIWEGTEQDIIALQLVPHEPVERPMSTERSADLALFGGGVYRHADPEMAQISARTNNYNIATNGSRFAQQNINSAQLFVDAVKQDLSRLDEEYGPLRADQKTTRLGAAIGSLLLSTAAPALYLGALLPFSLVPAGIGAALLIVAGGKTNGSKVGINRRTRTIIAEANKVLSRLPEEERTAIATLLIKEETPGLLPTLKTEVRKIFHTTSQREQLEESPPKPALPRHED